MIITFTKSNCLTYKYSKNTIIEVDYKKALLPRCDTMLNEVLYIFYYSKIANTGHHSYMFSVVHNSVQKITNILIMKPIILILILNKYLDILKNLDNRTPLTHTHTHARTHTHTLQLQREPQYPPWNICSMC